MRYQTVIAVAVLTLAEAAVLPAAAQNRDVTGRDGAAVVTDALDVHPEATPVERRGLVRQVRDEKVNNDKAKDDKAHEDKPTDDRGHDQAAHDDKAHDGKTADSKTADGKTRKATGHHHAKRAGSRTAAGSVEMLSALRRAQREKGNK